MKLLTDEQISNIKYLAELLADAHVTNSWKGGGDSADVPDIERSLELAEADLVTYLTNLTVPPAMVNLKAKPLDLVYIPEISTTGRVVSIRVTSGNNWYAIDYWVEGCLANVELHEDDFTLGRYPKLTPTTTTKLKAI